jgi:hypothetical protein
VSVPIAIVGIVCFAVGLLLGRLSRAIEPADFSRARAELFEGMEP